MKQQYWNRLKTLVVRTILGKPIVDNSIGENPIDYIKVEKKSEGILDTTKIVSYRIYWADGTISRWFVPGVNDSFKSLSLVKSYLDLLGKSHSGEVIYNWNGK